MYMFIQAHIKLKKLFTLLCSVCTFFLLLRITRLNVVGFQAASIRWKKTTVLQKGKNWRTKIVVERVKNMPEIQVRWFSTFPASHEAFPTFWILSVICNLERISALPLGSCSFHQIVAFLSWQYRRWLRPSSFCSIDDSAYTDKNQRQKSTGFSCQFKNSGEAMDSSSPWFHPKAQDTWYGCVCEASPWERLQCVSW